MRVFEYLQERKRKNADLFYLISELTITTPVSVCPQGIKRQSVETIIMPSYCCQHPTCTTYLPQRGYCPAHQTEGRKAKQQRHTYYDQHQRDPEAKRFYNSADWQAARATALAKTPWCSRCGQVFATTVHHIKPLLDCSAAERTAPDNLMCLCAPCHNEIEAEIRNESD
jgi:5-methylcytosine-specific restriction protein A